MSYLIPQKDQHPKDFFDSVWESLGTARGLLWLMTAILGFGGFLVWLLSVSELLAGVLLGFSGAFLFLAFLAKAKHEGELRPLTLVALADTERLGEGEGQQVLKRDKNTLQKKEPPRSNLIFAGIEYLNLYLDEEQVFWEIRRDGTRQIQPSFSALIRFSNESVAVRPGQPIKDLRARISYRDANTGQEFPPVNRAAWVRARYNSIDLAVGDSRSLIVGWGLPHGYQNPGFVFVCDSNHYSETNYGEHVIHKIDSIRLLVTVRLVAGRGGYVMYEDSFELCTKPRLVLYPASK